MLPVDKDKIIICGAAEARDHMVAGLKPKWMVSINDPGNICPTLYPTSVKTHKHFKYSIHFFDDVDSPLEKHHRTLRPGGRDTPKSTVAASKRDIIQIVEFADMISSEANQKEWLLIHCEGGISRSTAVAIIMVTYWLGPGSEAEAIEMVYDIRHLACPNKHIITLGDKVLKRKGQLLKAFNKNNCSQHLFLEWDLD